MDVTLPFSPAFCSQKEFVYELLSDLFMQPVAQQICTQLTTSLLFLTMAAADCCMFVT